MPHPSPGVPDVPDVPDVLPGRFFLPGPTEVRQEVLEAQVAPMIAHRGPAMRELMEPVQDGLRPLFGTARPVFVSTSSATGLMEAAIRNGVKERALGLVNGAFSARFAAIARACGRKVEVMEVPWGEAHDPDAVAARLDAGDCDAVTLVHSETSTGVLQPLPELAAVVADRPGVLLLVDAVTSVGGVPVEADAWNLDFVLTGSQKALALPPGLAFGVASTAMLERARTLPDRGLYFDLTAFEANLEKLQTPNTPALTLMSALVLQLARIRDEGIEARWARHHAMAERCWSRVDRLREHVGVGVRVLPAEPFRSPTVTCIELPDGVRGPEVVDAMRREGWVLGGGYGKLEETTIRIGHMGDHTVEGLDGLLDVLEGVLTR